MFEDAGGAQRAEKNDATEAAMNWIPPLDVYANDRTVVVSLEVPGLRPEDVELVLEGDTLTLRGVRERQHEGATFHRLERPMGPFERSVKLPSPVDPERAGARLELGVLTIRLERTAAVRPGSRRIKLES
jgi:HSP20 family protein